MKTFYFLFEFGSWDCEAVCWWQDLWKITLEFQEKLKNSPKTVVIWWTIVTLYSTHCNICHVSGDIETTAQWTTRLGLWWQCSLVTSHITNVMRISGTETFCETLYCHLNFLVQVMMYLWKNYILINRFSCLVAQIH